MVLFITALRFTVCRNCSWLRLAPSTRNLACTSMSSSVSAYGAMTAMFARSRYSSDRTHLYSMDAPCPAAGATAASCMMQRSCWMKRSGISVMSRVSSSASGVVRSNTSSSRRVMVGSVAVTSRVSVR